MSLKLFSAIVMLIGLIAAAGGLLLGILHGQPLGAMIGLLVGIALVVEGAWLLGDGQQLVKSE